MTQFMLCVPVPSPVASHFTLEAVRSDQPHLQDAAQAFFADPDRVYVPRLADGRSIHDAFDDAVSMVQNGGDFGQTQLRSILLELTECCESFATWWGNDWSDLPVFHETIGLLAEVTAQLREFVGDVYVRWERPGDVTVTDVPDISAS